LSPEFKKNEHKVIQLQHGLFDSSDSWFYAGEEHAIGFYVVNRGYDVWVGNNRGNKYSHTDTKNMSDSTFFDYCFDDMADHDLPAIYNYVLGQTGAEKLTWIGHSMGTSQFFAAAVDAKTKEFVTKKTEKFIALAPIVYMNHVGSNVLNLGAIIGSAIGYAAKTIGLYEIPPSCEPSPKLTRFFQWTCNTFQMLCDKIVPGISIQPKMDIVYDDTEKFFSHMPAGSSMKNLLKYAQAINMSETQVFQRYDYGFAGNMYHYHQTSAPVWDMSVMQVPTVLVGGQLDDLGSVIDVANLSAKMNPATTVTYTVLGYDHLTFLFPRDGTPMFKILEKELP
jgi:pimeloyl-ACP methyl ester carboxylesterase